MKFLSLFAVLIVAGQISAVCPTNPSKGVPTCPAPGRSTQLDERYPEQAFVVSMSPYNETSRSELMPQRFVEAVTRSHGNNIGAIPHFIIPTTRANFDTLSANLRRSLTAQYPGNHVLINQVMSNLVHVESPGWTWQQDFFESFYDPASGRPVLREVVSYRQRVSEGVQSEIDVLNMRTRSDSFCQTEYGAPLENLGGSMNSQMGGNIESLPGGLCMVGNNQARSYTQQFCPADSIFNVRTDWLSVGHADEIIKVLPNPNRAAPCDFTIAFASPRKALELLNQNRSVKFFDLSIYAGDEAALSEARMSRRDSIFFDIFKAHLWNNRRNAPTTPRTTPAKTIDGAYILKALLMEEAYANSMDDNMLNEMMTITNGELAAAISEDEELRDYNNLVQAEMDRIKREMITRITQRLPECRGRISTMDVPNLFSGAPVVRHPDGRKELPVPGLGNAMLPNPTNGVISNHTMVYPQQFNAAFNGYLKTETRNVTGLATDTMDTWDYAHVGSGNLHCATHALRFCRPR